MGPRTEMVFLAKAATDQIQALKTRMDDIATLVADDPQARVVAREVLLQALVRIHHHPLLIEVQEAEDARD